MEQAPQPTLGQKLGRISGCSGGCVSRTRIKRVAEESTSGAKMASAPLAATNKPSHQLSTLPVADFSAGSNVNIRRNPMVHFCSRFGLKLAIHFDSRILGHKHCNCQRNDPFFTQSGLHTDSIFGQARNTTVQVWTVGEGFGIGSEFRQTCCAANNFRDHDLD